jgi:hypothetical protein
MTRALDREEIERGLTPDPASLEQLEQVVRCAEQRARRAHEKLQRARAEQVAALIALCHAKAARTHFIANCPDDEPVML